MAPRHLTSIRDLSARDVSEIFELAGDVKASPGKYMTALAGKSVGLLFQTPSTRTRASFASGAHQLGGAAIALDEPRLALTLGESLTDTGRSLSGYLDVLVARTRKHADFVELSRACSVPVVNGLTDLMNPCHALADYFTLKERLGELGGKRIAFLGAGSPMCHSLIYGAIKVGMNIVVATPQGFEPLAIILKSAKREAGAASVEVSVTTDAAAAVEGASAVYVDNWYLSVPEAERPARSQAFSPYRVDDELMARAAPGAHFLHALPASRGQEAAPELVDGERSLVFEQSDNRLHVNKAILCAFGSTG